MPRLICKCDTFLISHKEELPNFSISVCNDNYKGRLCECALNRTEVNFRNGIRSGKGADASKSQKDNVLPRVRESRALKRIILVLKPGELSSAHHLHIVMEDIFMYFTISGLKATSNENREKK